MIAHLVQLLRKSSLFEQLKYKMAVEGIERGNDGHIITITLTDEVFNNQIFDDLVKYKDEQMKFNKIEFKIVSTINIKLRIWYYTEDVTAGVFIDDLNYLLITLYNHFDETFPLIFRLRSRHMYEVSEQTTIGLAKVFSKSDQTSVMTERELRFGLIKTLIKAPTFIESIKSMNKSKLNRMMANIKKSKELGEWIDLQWLKPV